MSKQKVRSFRNTEREKIVNTKAQLHTTSTDYSNFAKESKRGNKNHNPFQHHSLFHIIYKPFVVTKLPRPKNDGIRASCTWHFYNRKSEVQNTTD